MLFRRVAVAAVGAPLVLLVTAAGTWWTAALAAVLSFLAGLEARSLWRALGLGLPTLGVVAAAAAAPVGAAAAGEGGLLAVVALGTLAAGTAATAAAWSTAEAGSAARAAVGSLAFLLYPCALFSFAVLLRRLDDVGRDLLWASLVLTWATDSAAFFAGRHLNGPPLAPRLSPGKRWWGALAGLAAGGLVAAVAAPRFGLGAVPGAAVGLLLAALAQAGDLFESTLKRAAFTKDAGGWLPGHGGVLDRFDSFLFVAPAVYWAMRLLVMKTT